MAKHESICTLNPERICRWRIDGHSDGTRVVSVGPIAAELASRADSYPLSSDPESDERTLLLQEDIDWLRDEVDGCPACMLAALRQSGVDDFHFDPHSTLIFDYIAEVERLRTDERAQEYAF